MAQLPILTELIVSVVGGVLTAIVLTVFSTGRRDTQASASMGDVSQADGGRSKKSGRVGGFMRMLVAVVGGIVIALAIGRFLAQAGIIPRGPFGRIVLIGVATIGLWLILPFGRRH